MSFGPRALTLLQNTVLCVVTLSGVCATQIGAQPESQQSLGDAARRVREQRSEQKGAQGGDAQVLARHLEESQEFPGGAPVGFAWFRGKDLPYNVLLPEDAKFEEQKIDGNRYISPTMNVIVALRRPEEATGDNDAERIAAFTRGHLHCSALNISTVNDMKANIIPIGPGGRCGELYDFSGMAGIFARDETVFSVICGYRSIAQKDSTAGLGNASRRQDLAIEFRSASNTCDRIIRSVQLPKRAPIEVEHQPKKRALPSSIAQNRMEAQPAHEESLGTAARSVDRSTAVIENATLGVAGTTEYALPFCSSADGNCYSVLLRLPNQAVASMEGAVRRFTIALENGSAVFEAQSGRPSQRGRYASDETYIAHLAEYGWPAVQANYAEEYTTPEALAHREVTRAGNRLAVLFRTNKKLNSGDFTEVRAFVDAPGMVLNLRCQAPAAQFWKIERQCMTFIQMIRIEH